MPPLLRFLCWTLPLLLWDGIRLACLVICLAPGFVHFAWYYFVAAKRTSIRFGSRSCRQTLDVYSLSKPAVETETIRQDDDGNNSCETLIKAPVVVFYTGGAWMIGYKMWGTLLARALTAAGVVVVIPDMRNYPWGSVPSMIEDVEDSIAWTIENIANYGGDASKIVVVGQSAGGHVACTAILLRAFQEQQNDSQNEDNLQNNNLRPTRSNNNNTGEGEAENESLSSWLPSNIRGFVSLSAPYCLSEMQDSLQRHGLDENMVDRIFGGECDKYDPMKIIRGLQRRGQKLDSLPRIKVFHGDQDKTVPYRGSANFCNELYSIVPEKNRVEFQLYKDWTHTDPILEGPMDADQRFHKDLFDLVLEWTESRHLTWPEEDPMIRDRLCPRFFIQAARICNPF